MAKILGLDLGTSSIGWAIVEQHDSGYSLLEKGVDIFQSRVARVQYNEKPAVQDRTDAARSEDIIFAVACGKSNCSGCWSATISLRDASAAQCPVGPERSRHTVR